MLKVLLIITIVIFIIYFVLRVRVINGISEKFESICFNINNRVNGKTKILNIGSPLKERNSQVRSETQFIPNWILTLCDMNGNSFPTVYILHPNNPQIIVGTSADSSIRVNCKGSQFVGREHMLIESKGNALTLKDNNSKNGVFNSKHERVFELEVLDSDVVYLCDLIKIAFKKITPNDYVEIINANVDVKYVTG